MNQERMYVDEKSPLLIEKPYYGSKIRDSGRPVLRNADDAASSRQKAPIIDGGWGWMVVLGCSITHMLIGGWDKGYGIIYVKIRSRFQTSAALTVWVNGLCKALRMAGGPMATGLAKRFSVKVVAFIGGLIYASGVILVALVPSVTFSLFSIGVLAGLGGCLVYSPSIVHVGEYFDKKRGIATGLSTAGAGVGGVIFPPLVQILYMLYGFEGSFAILGAIMLNFCVAALLYRPLKNNRTSNPITNPESITDRYNLSDADPLKSDAEQRPPQQIVTENTDVFNSDFPEVKTGIRKYLDYKLLTNLRFLAFATSVGLATASYSTALILVADNAILNGAGEASATLLVSMLSVADVIGRFGSGVIFDISFVRPVRTHVYYWSIGVMGGAILLWAWMTSFVGLLVSGVIQSVAGGCVASQRAVQVADMVGIHQLSSAFGLLNFFQGVFLLIAPLIAGWLRDYTSDYMLSFVFCGSLGIIAFLWLYTTHIYVYFSQRHQGTYV